MSKLRDLIGINFFSKDRSQLLNLLTENLSTTKKTVFTPNPEILLRAEKNENLRNCLLTADVNLLDGVGIQLAQLILRKNIAPRHPGRIVLMDLLKLSEQKKLRAFFLGSRNKTLLDLDKVLRSDFPLLEYQFNEGSSVNEDGEPVNQKEEENMEKAIKKINDFSPHFLFVALGAPKQELWIVKNKRKINAKVFMTVGGSLDAISRNTIQIPDLVSKIGLEWLFRLIGQPERFFRIVNATLVFLTKVVFSKRT